ncbi:MAG: putative PEP-binding protein [Gemmatimonadaceae bacterium]|nr:putative PEP-binding protein [Gemmatimonadaceae bacterium]
MRVINSAEFIGQFQEGEVLVNPEEAFSLSFIPNEGVGLARMEFIISTYIKIHPLALIDFANLADPLAQSEIERLTASYADRPKFFVDKLAQGVAMIAAAFYPKDVILRLSDLKTSEYANLIGGQAYEPAEENPMIGFRGASRYYHPRYQAGFGLECRAVKKVRDEMGLTNLKLMIPFCRTIDEGRKVGVDRDSEIVAPFFDERNAAVNKDDCPGHRHLSRQRAQDRHRRRGVTSC